MKCMTFLFVIVLLCACEKQVEIQTPMEQVTVYYEAEPNQKVLFEPEQGTILLGAFIKEDKNITNMEEFEDITQKSHDIYGFSATLTEEFPMMDILECYVNQKIPLLVLQPPDRENPFQQIWLEQAAEKVSQYRIPLLVDFYPNGADYSTAEEYKKYYQKAVEIFNEKAPNVCFIFTMAIDDSEKWQQYYTESADWLGLSIYENGGNQGKDIAQMLERWYAIFQYKKPLMLSQVAISHYSKTDSKYTEKEASDEIKRLYESLEQYPQIKAIVYHSVNLTTQCAMKVEGENYSIVENKKVLQCYQNQIQNIKSIVQKGKWYKSFFKGYVKDGIIYIDKNTVLKEMALDYDEDTVLLEQKEYIPMQNIQGYYGERQQKDVVFLYKQ